MEIYQLKATFIVDQREEVFFFHKDENFTQCELHFYGKLDVIIPVRTFLCQFHASEKEFS